MKNEPGIVVAGQALFEGPARLGYVDLARPRHAIGKNTVSAVQSADGRVAPLAELPLQPAGAANAAAARAALGKFPFNHLPGVRLVFVNGQYSTALSSVHGLPAGAKVSNLAAAMVADSEFLKKKFGLCEPMNNNAFAALNQAFFTDGGFVHLSAGAAVADPIQLIFISTAEHACETIQPRNLIVAGADSRATVIESYIAADNTACFTNAVTEIVADDAAVLEHVKFQDESAGTFHLAAIAARLGRASNVGIHSFALGARLSRTGIRVQLDGEGLECVLNGLYLTRGEQLADHQMVVDHARPRGASHEYFNGILDGKSRGVFHGRILVREAAQKTDARQTNKNLLLSDDATADTLPQLEIYADDVKCTHGATVGQLNAESVFYLRSRGISADNARRMLVHAFAGEIIARVKHEGVRGKLDQLVWDRLEANHQLAKKN